MGNFNAMYDSAEIYSNSKELDSKPDNQYSILIKAIALSIETPLIKSKLDSTNTAYAITKIISIAYICPTWLVNRHRQYHGKSG